MKSEYLLEKCSECDYAAVCKSELNTHFIRKHRQNVELKKCEYEDCEYSTFQKRQQKVHYERVHLKLKRFSCNICDFGFYSRAGLTRHKDGVHLILKPEKCDNCKYAAYTKREVLVHIIRAHKRDEVDKKKCKISVQT